MVEIFIDPRLQYDAEVVEFLNSITSLGGTSQNNKFSSWSYVCFPRSGFSSQHDGMQNESRRPSEETCLQRQAGYTTDSRVKKKKKQLSVTHLTMSKNCKTEPLLNSDLVTVI